MLISAITTSVERVLEERISLDSVLLWPSSRDEETLTH